MAQFFCVSTRYAAIHRNHYEYNSATLKRNDYVDMSNKGPLPYWSKVSNHCMMVIRARIELLPFPFGETNAQSYFFLADIVEGRGCYKSARHCDRGRVPGALFED